MEQNSLFESEAGRRAAYRRLMLRDHGFLRLLWTHEYEIAPGVWRSNQPDPRRIGRWAARGIRTVLLLRGKPPDSPLPTLEREACDRHGIRLVRTPVTGGGLMKKDVFLQLLDAFKTAEKPMVMHCKSGIDRTGLAAFLYLVAETDTPPEIARRQLSFKYLHLNGKRHGILDFMADAYVAANRRSGVGLREWVTTEYDRKALLAAYAAGEAPV